MVFLLTAPFDELAHGMPAEEWRALAVNVCFYFNLRDCLSSVKLPPCHKLGAGRILALFGVIIKIRHTVSL